MPVMLAAFFRASAEVLAAAGPATPVPVVPPPHPAAVIGIDAVDVPSAYPRRFSRPGVYVVRVEPNSPAESARILPGDVIAQIGATSIADEHDYGTALGQLSPGSAMTVVVHRYGKTIDLRVAPVAPDTLYANAPYCNPDDVSGQLAAASVSARRAELENERAHGARALDLAETCASIEQRADEQNLLRVGDALTVIGTADAAQSQRDVAATTFANAWSMYHLVATSPASTADLRAVASSKEATLEKRVPGIASRADGAIAKGVEYSGATLGTAPFTVVNTWNTNGDNYAKLLHVRIKIDTDRDALLFASGFRVTLPSTDSGDESFFAQDTPASETVRGHSAIDRAKNDIDPSEDFGNIHYAFVHRGEAVTYVLTFVVSDRTADLTNAASTLTYAPQ